MAGKPIFERKNVLITGGAGFIGSHLCDELIKTSKVICIDNFSTGKEENINHLLKHPDFEFIRHDLSEPLPLADLPELRAFKVPFQGIQEIYHLACPTSPRAYRQEPIATVLANSHATRQVLDWAAAYQAKCLIFSSGAVYGEPRDATPFPEEYFGYVDPVGVRSAFEEGKRFAESLAKAYRETKKVDVKIARMFNVYGPRMKPEDGRMVPEMIMAALRGEPLTAYGSSTDTTTLCYITDLLEGIGRLMRSQEHGPVNLGSDTPMTLQDVAQQIVQLTGGTSEIRYAKRPPEFVRQGTPSIQRARERLGWFPVVALAEGLRVTVEYLRGAKALTIENVKI